MDPFKSTTTSSKRQQQQVNPLSQSLVETEQSLHSNQPSTSTTEQIPSEANNLFSQALANTGGAPNTETAQSQNQPIDPLEQARQQEAFRQEQKKKEIRAKLHRQINPVDQEEVFRADRERVHREIEQLRISIQQEFADFKIDLEKFHSNVDIAVFQSAADTGFDATGYRSFFEKLRAFIVLLRQRVKSANTWLKQSQAKKGKKRKKGKKPGLEIGGQSHEQTKAVYDMMNHEVGGTYGSN